MSEHTPGPWVIAMQADPKAGWKGLSVESAAGYVANLVMQPGGDNERANARLIAAAPDLLEILKTTAENVRSLGPCGALGPVFEPYAAWLTQIEAAIAKAEGRSQS